MRPGLERADEARQIAYLEATSIPNRAFYERHGFEALDQIQVGDAPPIWPMVRQPKVG